MGHLGPKRGQNEVLDHFLTQDALVADFAYYGLELRYLVPNGGQSAENFFRALPWAHVSPN